MLLRILLYIKENPGREVQKYPFLLPVHLSTWNLLPPTKSSVEEDSSFVFSYSLLDSVRILQEEIKPGKVITQTPLKGELFCRSVSFLPSGSDAPCDIVKARLYHIRYEDCLQSLSSEYLATMIPGWGQEQRDTSYSYLNMPNFTGSILFSDLSGCLMDVWEVAEGRIFECTLDKKEGQTLKRGLLSTAGAIRLP